MMAAGDIALNMIVRANATNATGVIGNLGKAMSMLGGSPMAAVAVGAAAAGAALLGIGVYSVKMAGDFQASMTRLVTSAGELPKNLKMISDGILAMSVATGTSTQQLAAGMYYVESSGKRGADALRVLTVAAQGAKTENADLITVSKALTTVMTDYHMPVSQAAAAMNGLIAAVQNGKTNLQELSSSMGNVLPIASALHISFPQVAGAMDTMTNAGMSSRQAAMNLAHVLVALQAPSGVASKSMKEVGLSAQQVRDALVHQGLPQALQMIEDHVGHKFKAGSVEGTTALKNILGGLVGLKLAAMLTGPSLKDTEDHIKKVSDAMHKGGQSVLGWSDIQKTFNFKMDQAKSALSGLFIQIGTALLPVVGKLLDKIVPMIQRFGDWLVKSGTLQTVIGTLSTVIGNVVGYVADFSAHSDVLVPILAGLGAILLMVVVPAVFSLAAGVIAATWPFLAVGLAVAGLVAIFKHFYDTNKGFKAFVDNMVAGFKLMASIIGTGIGKAVDMFTNNMEKMRLQAQLKMTSMRIHSDDQTMKMATNSIHNLEVQRVGILQKLKETHDPAERRELEFQLHQNKTQLDNQAHRLQAAENDKRAQLAKQKQLHDQMLEAQKWFGQRFLDMVGTWLGNVFSAIGTWVHNTLTRFKNFFGDTFSNLGSFVRNFLDRIGQWKDSVIAKVVQLVNNFVSTIQQLPGRVGGWIATMANTVRDKLATLATNALTWGANIVKNIASGIIGAIGSFLGNAMSQVGGFISSHLPHSPAKVGPLRDLQLQGSLIPQQIALGMFAGTPHLTSAMNRMLSPVSSRFAVRGGGSSFALSGGGSQVIVIQIQPQAVKLDGRQIAEVVGQRQAKEIRINGHRNS